MRQTLTHASAIVLCAIGLIAAGCATQVPVAGPSGSYVILAPPYIGLPPGERTDRIAVQYAVIEVARQAGFGYDWDKSFANTNPTCRLFIRPRIKGKPFQKALDKILKPVHLTYRIEGGKVVLLRRL
jgi:hypothetical protein